VETIVSGIGAGVDSEAETGTAETSGTSEEGSEPSSVAGLGPVFLGSRLAFIVNILEYFELLLVELLVELLLAEYAQLQVEVLLNQRQEMK
jgi:hypothetical protein